MSNPDFVTSVPKVGHTTHLTTRQATLEHVLNTLDVRPETIDSVSLNWKLVGKLCVILLRYSILISSVQCCTHVGFPISSS